MLAGLLAGGIGGILQGVIGVAGKAITSHYEIKKLTIGMEQSKIDYSHESAMAQLEYKSIKQGAAFRLLEAKTNSESAMSIAAYKHDENLGGKDVSPWVNTYRATVRPNLTYLTAFVYFGFVGYMLWSGQHEFTIANTVVPIAELLSGVFSFWFVQRSSHKTIDSLAERVIKE